MKSTLTKSPDPVFQSIIVQLIKNKTLSKFPESIRMTYRYPYAPLRLLTLPSRSLMDNVHSPVDPEWQQSAFLSRVPSWTISPYMDTNSEDYSQRLIFPILWNSFHRGWWWSLRWRNLRRLRLLCRGSIFRVPLNSLLLYKTPRWRDCCWRRRCSSSRSRFRLLNHRPKDIWGTCWGLLCRFLVMLYWSAASWGLELCEAFQADLFYFEETNPKILAFSNPSPIGITNKPIRTTKK